MSEFRTYVPLASAAILVLGGCAAQEAPTPFSGVMSQELSLTSSNDKPLALDTDPISALLSYKNCNRKPDPSTATHFINIALQSGNSHLKEPGSEVSLVQCEAVDVTLPETVQLHLGGAAVESLTHALPFLKDINKKVIRGDTYTQTTTAFNTYTRSYQDKHSVLNFGDVSSLQDFFDKDFDTYFKTVNNSIVSTVTLTEIAEKQD